jgi:hypothetical protein
MIKHTLLSNDDLNKNFQNLTSAEKNIIIEAFQQSSMFSNKIDDKTASHLDLTAIFSKMNNQELSEYFDMISKPSVAIVLKKLTIGVPSPLLNHVLTGQTHHADVTHPIIQKYKNWKKSNTK